MPSPTRWLRNAIAAVLAFVAVMLTAYPLPAFPLNWLPAVAACILFGMLLLQEQPEASIPTAHVEAMGRLAEELTRDLDARRSLRFSIEEPHVVGGGMVIHWPTDPEAKELWRGALRSHYPQVYRDLVELENRSARFDDVNAIVDRRVLEVAAALEAQHGINIEHAKACVLRAASAQLKTPPEVARTPSNFHITDSPLDGLTLFWGGSGIASSRAVSAEADLGEARDALIAASDSVRNWSELVTAREALAAREAQGQTVRRELVELANSHSLPGRCRICR